MIKNCDQGKSFCCRIVHMKRSMGLKIATRERLAEIIIRYMQMKLLIKFNKQAKKSQDSSWHILSTLELKWVLCFGFEFFRSPKLLHYFGWWFTVHVKKMVIYGNDYCSQQELKNYWVSKDFIDGLIRINIFHKLHNIFHKYFLSDFWK